MPHICVSESGQHWFRQWLVAYWAPSHYLNQCWVIVNENLRNKVQWNFNQNKKLFIHENAFENVVCEMADILSRGRWVNGIDGHIHLIKMLLACLKINIKHLKNIDVETCRLRPVTSQCTKWLFPTAAMCVKQSRPMKRLDTSVVKGKCQHNVTGVSGAQFQ